MFNPTTISIRYFQFLPDEKSFIYASEEYENAKHLCIIIHGSGVVRAGQWARRLIMNDSLDLGN